MFLAFGVEAFGQWPVGLLYLRIIAFSVGSEIKKEFEANVTACGRIRLAAFERPLMYMTVQSYGRSH